MLDTDYVIYLIIKRGYDNYHPGNVDIVGVCSSTGISSARRLMSRYPDHLPVGSGGSVTFASTRPVAALNHNRLCLSS